MSSRSRAIKQFDRMRRSWDAQGLTGGEILTSHGPYRHWSPRSWRKSRHYKVRWPGFMYFLNPAILNGFTEACWGHMNAERRQADAFRKALERGGR